jgi:hypothetical protein
MYLVQVCAGNESLRSNERSIGLMLLTIIYSVAFSRMLYDSWQIRPFAVDHKALHLVPLLSGAEAVVPVTSQSIGGVNRLAW